MARAPLAILLAIAPAARAEDQLEEKAHAFREALVERHLAREGIVVYRIDLERRGDLERGAYPNLADTPTFTGLFAAASCMRAEEESESAEALADAERALSGLEFLMAVTGIPGLLARGARRANTGTEGLRGEWRRAPSPHEGWIYRGDVSVDQYANGLLPAAAACAPYFRERVRSLVTSFADHLLANGLRLVDVDGKRTRFGDLSPRSGLGFNAIYQLAGYAALSLAAELDPAPRFAQARDRLRDRERVLERARTTNPRLGAITNHSNDLMAWNLYRVLLPLAERSGDPGLADLRHGMHRTWLRVREDRNAYFALLRCWLEPSTCERASVDAARDQLTRFPLDKRKRPPPPELAALSRRWLPDRKGRRIAREPVPIELRPVSSLEWKSSPYRLTGEGRPEIEYTGVDYLLAYWLLRRVESRLDERDR